ncbi:uracil-DNA glycosylase [Sulfurimonas sp.]|uniref:uracil-DNA glycosylase n=1 Tax=Sulfurimonas sp. TaxID=2022749 RepID=UPI00356864E9
MDSYQNLALLQNLYRLKALGYEYTDPFSINSNSHNEKPLNISQLYQNISLCHLCDLSKSRSQSMPGFGNKDADLMIVDYSVSQNDDKLNSYYSGRSGEILKKMIENVLELTTENIFYTHAVKCKPLNANKPSQSEWESCKNYLFSQIEFIKPKVIVTLGKEAYAKITGVDEDFENVRGHVIDFREYKLVPIHHPSFLLRNPESKKTTYNDLITIKSCL